MAGHHSTWTEHCRRHELAYPVDADGAAMWRPSVRARGWKVSGGRGSVYATTVVRRRDEEPYDLSLIELDEGFRMMARVDGLPPEAVRIGMRVRVAWTDGDPPVPFFVEDEPR